MKPLVNDPESTEGRDRAIEEEGGHPIYIYLCNGKVQVVDEAMTIDIRPDTLQVFCPNCRDVTLPRKGIYMCARMRNMPPVPD
jgi:hypothetical protein